MKVSELKPPPIERILFKRWQQRTTSPQTHGCYVIASIDEDILYIGQSVNIGDRMDDHLGDTPKNRMTSEGIAYWLYYVICESSGELNNLERGWVLQYRGREGKLPPLNKIMPPV